MEGGHHSSKTETREQKEDQSVIGDRGSALHTAINQDPACEGSAPKNTEILEKIQSTSHIKQDQINEEVQGTCSKSRSAMWREKLKRENPAKYEELKKMDRWRKRLQTEREAMDQSEKGWERRKLKRKQDHARQKKRRLRLKMERQSKQGPEDVNKEATDSSSRAQRRKVYMKEYMRKKRALEAELRNKAKHIIQQEEGQRLKEKRLLKQTQQEEQNRLEDTCGRGGQTETVTERQEATLDDQHTEGEYLVLEMKEEWSEVLEIKQEWSEDDSDKEEQGWLTYEPVCTSKDLEAGPSEQDGIQEDQLDLEDQMGHKEGASGGDD